MYACVDAILEDQGIENLARGAFVEVHAVKTGRMISTFALTLHRRK